MNSVNNSVSKSVFPAVHHPLKVPSALVGGPSELPEQISGLQLWLDARSLSQADGSAVASWTDATGKVAAQGNAANRPVYVAASSKLNGQACVRFTAGSEHALTLNGLNVARSDCAIIMAFAAPVQTGTGSIFSFGTGANGWMRQESNNARLNAHFGNWRDTGVFLGTDTPELYSFRFAGSSVSRANGKQTRIANPTSAGVETALTIGEYGGKISNGFNWSGDLAQLLIYSPAPSLAEIEQIEGYIRGLGYGVASAVTAEARTVCCVGNSITRGINLPNNNNYPAQLEATLGVGWDTYNFGINGSQINAFPIAGMLSPKLADDPLTTVVVFGGTNNLFFGQTDTQTYTAISDYCSSLRAAGLRVFVLTILPRGGSPAPPGNFETFRQSVNTSIRANWATFADALVDVAADPRIGDAGDQLDTFYFSDEIHLTVAGCGVIAELVNNVFVPPLTWDASKKSSFVTITSNIDAVSTGGVWNSVLGTVGRSSGKRYYEMRLQSVANNNILLGLATTNGTYETFVGVWTTSASKQLNGSNYQTGMAAANPHNATLAVNDVLGIAVDMDLGRVWLSKNGSYADTPGADPVNGINPWRTFTPGATLFPAASFNGNVPGNIVRLLARSSLVYSPPAGFSAW